MEDKYSKGNLNGSKAVTVKIANIFNIFQKAVVSIALTSLVAFIVAEQYRPIHYNFCREKIKMHGKSISFLSSFYTVKTNRQIKEGENRKITVKKQLNNLQ